jgi:hypothetical protein
MKKIKKKRKRKEEDEEKLKKIRCWWFTISYNRPAIKWLISYQEY